MTTRYDASGGGEGVSAFVDEHWSAVMVKVVTAHGDPVELTSQEARHLASALVHLADELDRHDAEG